MTKLSGLENLVARRHLILAGAALLVAVVGGAGFVPNFTSSTASVSNVTGGIAASAELRSLQWASTICQFASTFDTIQMPSSQDVFNKLADGLLPRNRTISTLVQNISSLCFNLQSALNMESQYAPNTQEYDGWNFVAYMTTLEVRQIMAELNVGQDGKLPVEIQLIGFIASVTLTVNIGLPFKITNFTTTNKNTQASSFTETCHASCYPTTITTALTVGSIQAPISSWEPIKVTLTINYEVPTVWLSFILSYSQRTLTVNLELNPATDTVRLA